nr:reverse transcriptase domain-containing protein [Tanacetum cinerariifolium]
MRKEKIEAHYGKFLDMIRAVRINVPLIDVLARMPNYGKFLKELVSNCMFSPYICESADGLPVRKLSLHS